MTLTMAQGHGNIEIIDLFFSVTSLCEILFEAFMHRENEILLMKSGLHAQHAYGCHAHKCSNLLQNRWAGIPETWTLDHHSLFKWWPRDDLDLFYGKVNFGNIGFYMYWKK